jgi:hypothetical protein
MNYGKVLLSMAICSTNHSTIVKVDNCIYLCLYLMVGVTTKHTTLLMVAWF